MFNFKTFLCFYILTNQVFADSNHPAKFNSSLPLEISKSTIMAWSSWIPPNTKWISSDGENLCAVNNADDVFVSNAPPGGTTLATWVKIEGKLKQCVRLGDSIYGVNSADHIFYGRWSKYSKSPHWVQLPGSLKQISFDGVQIAGCNSGDHIYVADVNIMYSPNWRYVPGGLKQVVVRSGLLYGVNSAGLAFVGNSYGQPNWKQLPGTFKYIDYDGTTLFAVNDKDEILVATENLKSSPNWEKYNDPDPNILNSILKVQLMLMPTFSKFHDRTSPSAYKCKNSVLQISKCLLSIVQNFENTCKVKNF